MPSNKKPSFEFSNQISPYYIEPLFLQLESGQWYDSEDLKQTLRSSGLDVDGSSIVRNNAVAWVLLGLMSSKQEKVGRYRINFFQLLPLGEYLVDTYSTHPELFYDLFHFLFFSAWRRSQDLRYVRFWLYSSVCESLWPNTPQEMDTHGLTNRLLAECQQAFPKYNPSFPRQSVNAVFPWLQVLRPAYLVPVGSKTLLCSEYRKYCTPQLFHLATDLIYTTEGLQYGTAMAVGDKNIEAICKVCLLDPDRFWQMADLTKMTIRGFELQRGQWGSGIVLNGPPEWIDLPTYTVAEDADADVGDDVEDDIYDEEA